MKYMSLQNSYQLHEKREEEKKGLNLLEELSLEGPTGVRYWM